ncbi:hypothetical protein UlMin_015111 [Ulmus minor]
MFEQMPKYAKFLKEVLSNKRRLDVNEKVMLTEECSAILQRKLPPNVLDKVVAENFHESFPSSPLENCILNGKTIGTLNDEGIIECVNNLDALPIFEGPKSLKFKELGVFNVNTISSNKEPPKLKLKELPSHLRYAFLEESSYYHVIINSYLNDLEEEKLLRVLREHRKAIGWTIDDIKGISPSICMHKILMEETYKPLVQPQQRLNPSMQEVVKKEVVKLMDAGIIYPISDKGNGHKTVKSP